jgi:hypothetical protein
VNFEKKIIFAAYNPKTSIAMQPTQNSKKRIAAKDLTTKAKDHNWILHPIILVFKGWELAEYEVMG